MGKKTWIIFGLVCAVFVAVIVGFNVAAPKATKVDISNVNIGKIIGPSAQNGQIGDSVNGKQDSKVVLIEYGDYECSACAYAYPRIHALSIEYKDEVAFVFRNYPIPSLHPNALTAATVAIAASLQGNDVFWKMHDALYEHQETWISSSIDNRLNDIYNLAATVGVNKNQLKKDVTGDATKKRIDQKLNFDAATAKKFNLQGTPSFYLNGKEVSSDVWSDDTKFRELLDKELKKYNITPPKHDSAS
ncbi:thioredoxin domain-containing protein [Candidatus Saccharibacteria bacterium]|nr:thioredoxin domain-containing protein [Candidatus Saccharibacteria bacterium]